MKCLVCGIEFESSRETAKYCSAKCRKLAFLKKSVSVPNGPVKVSVPAEKELAFQFTIIAAKDNPDDVKQDKARVRTAKYWYDVPLAAQPKLQKSWPKMPDFMNGRQYFLWWKNDFKVQQDGTPVIFNPFPKRDNVVYYNAAEGSRRWGL